MSIDFESVLPKKQSQYYDEHIKRMAASVEDRQAYSDIESYLEDYLGELMPNSFQTSLTRDWEAVLGKQLAQMCSLASCTIDDHRLKVVALVRNRDIANELNFEAQNLLDRIAKYVREKHKGRVENEGHRLKIVVDRPTTDKMEKAKHKVSPVFKNRLPLQLESELINPSLPMQGLRI